MRFLCSIDMTLCTCLQVNMCTDIVNFGPGNVTLVTGMVFLALGITLWVTYARTSKAHVQWQAANEILWTLLSLRQIMVVMHKFHSEVEPQLEDLLMGSTGLMLAPFFMAWTQVSSHSPLLPSLSFCLSLSCFLCSSLSLFL